MNSGMFVIYNCTRKRIQSGEQLHKVKVEKQWILFSAVWDVQLYSDM